MSIHVFLFPFYLAMSGVCIAASVAAYTEYSENIDCPPAITDVPQILVSD
jgi:hypothetical protein